MRAKKSLGQNFLRSESAIQKMLDAAEVSEGDLILEIGPGQGALTEKMLGRGAKVIAIETDQEMVAILKDKFAEEVADGRLELIKEDVLKYSPENLPNYKIVANIPYYITGEIIRKFLSDIENQPQKMSLLMQKEVADRIMTRDGKESLLSISVKAYCTPKYIDTVKAGSFVPAPKVNSGIILFDQISKNFFSNKKQEAEFFKLIRAGFSHKRKRLLSNLKKEGGYDVSDVLKNDTSVTENTRAEELSTDQWRELLNILI